MSKGIFGKMTRSILLFLGGMAVGYLIKTFVGDDSLDQIRYRTRDLINKPADKKEYIDVEINDITDDTD